MKAQAAASRVWRRHSRRRRGRSDGRGDFAKARSGLVNNAAGNFISRTEDLSPRGFDAIAKSSCTAHSM